MIKNKNRKRLRPAVFLHLFFSGNLGQDLEINVKYKVIKSEKDSFGAALFVSQIN
jgi:ribosomal protein L28